MNIERRKFLQQMAAVCTGGFARSLGVGVLTATPVVAAATAATATAATAASATGVAAALAYGPRVRGQVFEVIVRQAIAGAPWQQICQGPMQVNGITEAEVKAEVARRKVKVHTSEKNAQCYCPDCTLKFLAKRREYMAKVDALPHSALSPCACADCRLAVRQTTESIRKEFFPNEI